MNPKKILGAVVLANALVISSSNTAFSAENDLETLRQTVEQLQEQLVQVREQLAEQEKSLAQKEDVDVLREEIRVQQKAFLNVDKNGIGVAYNDSIVHLAGYGSTIFADKSSQNSSFNQVKFAPIFHYQYKDLMLLESELEVNVGEDGETEIGLEYLTLDLFLNDYMAVIAGKFLSPIGQFRQNIHPSWINKLPSAPPGFGHDGAAPISDVGIQLRGGLPSLGSVKTNYAVYIANGPELDAMTEGGDVELEGIMAEGFTRDADGGKVVGGRFGILPIPSLEIGLSGATGNATITQLDGNSVTGDASRSYRVVGTDFAWNNKAMGIRGEYVKSTVGGAAGSMAPEGAEWKAWYMQGSYKILPTKLEGVVRYSDFDSPHSSEDQTQWALGINYLFSSNVIAKAAYEFNSGASGQPSDIDTLLLELAFGF